MCRPDIEGAEQGSDGHKHKKQGVAVDEESPDLAEESHKENNRQHTECVMWATVGQPTADEPSGQNSNHGKNPKNRAIARTGFRRRQTEGAHDLGRPPTTQPPRHTTKTRRHGKKWVK